MTTKTKTTKKRCKNCNCLTDSPAFINAKLVCQKCALYYNAYKSFPTKRYIKKLKEAGLWKK